MDFSPYCHPVERCDVFGLLVASSPIRLWVQLVDPDLRRRSLVMDKRDASPVFQLEEDPLAPE
jgi:hypothetical protein